LRHHGRNGYQRSRPSVGWDSAAWGDAAREYHDRRKRDPLVVGSAAYGKPALDIDQAAVPSLEVAKRDQLGVLNLCDVEPQQTEWLWRARVPAGKLTLFAGDPGLGKSQIAIDVAARITVGGDWPDGGNAPLGNVIILSAEDGVADTLRPRFEAAGGNLDRVNVVTAVTTKEGGRRTFSLQADLALLGARVQEFGGVKLVIIDPVTSYCGKVDGNSTTDIRAVLAPLAEFAERYKLAVIAVSHPPKSVAGGKALYAVTGSLAWIAAARTAFTIVEDASDRNRRLFLNSKNNLAPLAGGLGYRLVQRIVTGNCVASHVEWDNLPVTVSADQALAATASDTESRTASAEAQDFLREYLASGPMSAKEGEEHAKAHGIASRTLARARKSLRVLAEKDGLKGGWYWRLPSEGCQTPPKNATPKGWQSSAFLAAFDAPASKLAGNDLADYNGSAPDLGPPGDRLEDFE
jgi:AAA domain